MKNIFRSVYNKVTGKDVKKIQSDIINSYEREIAELTEQLKASRIVAGNRQVDVQILQGRVDELSAVRRGLELDIRNLQNQPTQVVDRFVMTHQVYDKFVRSMEPPVVTNNTTAQGAGYLVGMQRVLEKLREQFVA